MREHIQVNVQTGERNVVPYTDEENRLADEAKAKQDAYEAEFGYIDKRKADYPTIQEQLDMQYWDSVNGTTLWKDMVTSVKAKYPKGVK